MRRLGASPMRAVGLVLASILALVVSPLWGLLHPWAGWHACRARLDNDGLAALGEVLVPSQALHDYKDGIWRGLYRVHMGWIAFVVLQLPLLAIAFTPVLLAVLLFAPVAEAYPTNDELQMLFTQGVPGLVALGVLTVVLGQILLACRVLGTSHKPHRTGTCYHATGASWRAALQHADALASLGMLTILVAGALGALAFVNVTLADSLGILQPDAIGLWIATAAAIVVGALLLETLGEWSDECEVDFHPPAEPYSFVQWLIDWLWHCVIVDFLWGRLIVGLLWRTLLLSAFQWLSGPGLAVVCVGIVVLVGGFVGKTGTGSAFGDGSWSGLAWFLSCAGILLFLRHQQQKGGA